MSPRILPQRSMPNIQINPRSAAGVGDDRPTAGSTLVCRTCRTRIASRMAVLSWAFRGYSGRAALFSQAHNTTLAKPSIILMNSGAHTIQECSCKSCSSYLGWRITKAHEWPEKWKEGNWVLELDCLTEELLDDSPVPSPLTTPTKKEYSKEETTLTSSSPPPPKHQTHRRTHMYDHHETPLPPVPPLSPTLSTFSSPASTHTALPPTPPSVSPSTSPKEKSKIRSLHMSKMLGIGRRGSNTDLSKHYQKSQGPISVPVPVLPLSVQGSHSRQT